MCRPEKERNCNFRRVAASFTISRLFYGGAIYLNKHAFAEKSVERATT
jgi:hypothetical protein